MNVNKPDAPGQVMDSAAIAAQVASKGALSFYLHTLRNDPLKILIGISDSLIEVFRFIVYPRFKSPFGLFQRVRIVGQFARAELKIPGGTTLLEAIWLTYGAWRATSPARSWVEVGCFKGLSTARLSIMCAVMDTKLYVYDTFSGLPGSDSVYVAVDNGVSYHFKTGSYLGLEEEVRHNVAAFGVLDRVALVKGNVEETLKDNKLGKVSFGFLDVDLVESYKACFSGLAGNLESGSVIAIHEACYAPIRSLIEDGETWKKIGVPSPTIEYVAERYKIASCRNIAFLMF